MTRPPSPPTVSSSRDQNRYPFLLPPVEADEIGRLGNYRVLHLLGRGGMGYVFHAEDLTLRRPVALKVLKPDLEGSVKGCERFLREAQLMAAIKHESLVTVFQAGQEGDTVYLAMELLEGATLEEWFSQNPSLPVGEIIRLAREIAAALAIIHRHGLVHRDIKPGNLWLEAPGQHVKILDFGLARYVEDRSLTQTGTILGTPSFMSPEQARGEPVDPRSDLFSLGCIIYYLCTGKDPFFAETISGTLTALAISDPKPIRQLNPSIPLALSDLASELLAKDPDDRPASAEDVLERLEDIKCADSSTVATKKMKTAAGDRKTGRLSKRRQSRNQDTVHPGKKKWLLLAAGLAVIALIATSICLLIFLEANPKGPGQANPKGAGQPEMVFLTTLEPAEQVNWPFLPPRKGAFPFKGKGKPPKDKGEFPFKGKGKPPPKDKGKPPPKGFGGVQVNGIPSPHGIFMHPPHEPGSPASLSYDLAKQYAKFQADVTYNDGPSGSFAPCTFAVYGDGKLLWKSRPISSQAHGQKCALDVTGVNKLTIAVTCAGEPKGAHAVWVEPCLMK
jgi:serine/threonine protein kinase